VSISVTARTVTVTRDEWVGVWKDSLTDLSWCIQNRLPGKPQNSVDVEFSGSLCDLKITISQCSLTDAEIIELLHSVLAREVARPSIWAQIRNRLLSGLK
jgi:hypothetical protein